MLFRERVSRIRVLGFSLLPFLVLTFHGARTSAFFSSTERVCSLPKAPASGGGGDDWIYSASSGVCIDSSDGDDYIKVSFPATNVEVIAGEGDDVVKIDPWTSRVKIDGGRGNDTVSAWGDVMVVNSGPGNDSIILGSGDDVVFAGPGADSVVGGFGDDEIDGGDGNDEIWGKDGSDTIRGSFGDDLIFGDDGWGFMGYSDMIEPGPGEDRVFAGPGDDVVDVYDMCEVKAGEILDGGWGLDTLRSPVSIEELRAAGIEVRGFEQVELSQRSCQSPCVRVPDCSGRGRCQEGSTHGQVECSCYGRYGGENCGGCKPQFTGNDCQECSERFTGPECAECKAPFTGEDCKSCLPPWRGEKCDECPARRSGPDCSDCSYPFTGPSCSRCVPPHSGPNCESCTNGMSGPQCDQCDPSDQNSCSRRGTCVALNDGEELGYCDCPSGIVGVDCSESVRDLSINWNEGPETFEKHRTPDAHSIGVTSVVHTQSFRLQGSAEKCSGTLDLPVDAAGDVFFVLSSSGKDVSRSVSVLGPAGSSVDFQEDEDGHVSDKFGSSQEFYFFAENPGLYRLLVSDQGQPCEDGLGKKGVLDLQIPESERILYANWGSLQFWEGNTITVEARVLDSRPESDGDGRFQEPQNMVLGDLIRAKLVDGTNGREVELNDEGTNGDRAPGDGIYSGRLLLSQTGLWDTQVFLEGRSRTGLVYQRTQNLPLFVTHKNITAKRSQGGSVVAVDDTEFPGQHLSSSVPGPEDHLKALEMTLALETTLDARQRWTNASEVVADEEYDTSALLYAVEPDTNRDYPVAWVSKLQTPKLRVPVPEGSSSGEIDPNSDLYFGFRVEGGWFASAKSTIDPGAKFQDFRFELRDVRIVERKTQTLIEHHSAISIELGESSKYAMEILEPRALPIDEIKYGDLLHGAPPEFVSEVESQLEASQLGGYFGDIYLMSGYCGTPQTTWFPSYLVNIYLAQNKKDARGESFYSRLRYGHTWFTGENGARPRFVSLEKMADAHAQALRKQSASNPVSQIWAMSQGGVAAVEMMRRWNSLYAFKTKMKDAGLPLVHSVAAAFGGTPLAGRSIGARLLRVLTMIFRGCIPDGKSEWTGVLTRGDEFATYGVAPSALRLASTPVHIQKMSSYSIGTHRRMRGFFAKRKQICSRVTSRFFLDGEDDGLVQWGRAQLPDGVALAGYAPIRGYCHASRPAHGRFANPFWRWILDTQSGVPRKLCEASPLFLANQGLCDASQSP